jgi:competence protein ComEC
MKKYGFLLFLVFSFFVFSFYFQTNLNNYKLKTEQYNKILANRGYLTLEGVVETTPEIYGKNHGYFLLKIIDKKYGRIKNLLIRIYFKSGERLRFFRGDIVKIYAGFYSIKRLNNFYKSFSDNYFLSEKISGTGYIKTIALITKTGVKNPIYHYLSEYKYDFSRFLDKCGVDKQSISIIKAVIIGERKGVPDKLKFLWKESGIYHLLAISGAHIGLLSLLLFYLLSLFKIDKRKIYYFQIFFILSFLLFIGYNPPVFRASVMIVLYFIGKLLWRDIDILHIVSLSGIIYLSLFPLSLLGAGFILTYYTTIFLILIFRKFSHLFFVSLKIENSLYLVFFAFMISLPLNIYFFNYAPFGSIIINFIAVFLIPLILFFSFFSLVLFKISAIAAFYLIKPAILFINIINITGEKIGSHLFIRPITPPFLFVFISISLLLLFILIKKRKSVFFILTIISLLFLTFFPEKKISNSSVYFLNVGQGDSSFVETPSCRFLIDCGGSYKKNNFIGEYIVSGFLFKHRVKKIDGIFISHFHPDHYYGCLRIIKNFNVDKIYIYNSIKKIEGFKELTSVIDKRKTKIIFLKHGDKVKIGESRIIILHPDKNIVKRVSNNDSLVVKVILGDWKILFTGDLEKEGEKMILTRNEDIKADILKVAHHGSKTSSTEEFIKKVAPAFAVISVGKGNRYHLPSRIIIKRFDKAGIKILQTSEKGGIKFSFSKKKISLYR